MYVCVLCIVYTCPPTVVPDVVTKAYTSFRMCHVAHMTFTNAHKTEVK